ncbi:MAG TPA: ABC transporter permease [Dermatophilaceae bacterium]|nr:ABC transporter permease [Dermatophilaceae bacterium]
MAGVVEYFLVVYRRTWRASVATRFLSPVLFLLAMGLGLGTLVDERAGGIDGTSYLRFVVPGIVATQAMWVAMGESTWQVFAYIKWNKMYAAMLATPVRVGELLAGHLAVVAAQIGLATAIFTGVAAAFGGFASWWAWLCLPFGLLTGMAFTVPIFAFTASQQTEDGFNILFRLVMTPLMLFSGTFFPVDQLPAPLRPVAWATPLFHGVELCRGAATGDLPPWPSAGHALVLVAFVAVGGALALRAFTRRLVP